MQSAGLRTRGRPSVADESAADSVSILTLHTLPEGAPSSKSSRRPANTNSSRSKNASSHPSSNPSSNPSLIIQRPDTDSQPGTSRARSNNSSRSMKETADKPVTDRRSRRQETGRPTRKAAPKAIAVDDSSDDDQAVVQEEPDEQGDEEEEEEEDRDFDPPKFTIDLSKAPFDRYNHVAQHFIGHKMILEKLFREIAKEMLGWSPEKGRVWGRRIFRKIPSAEEMEEISGISHVWGVEKFLLVAFNVLLDAFMGCTSGGARVRDPEDRPSVSEEQTDLDLNLTESHDSRGRMLHFRTLDWGMEPLRKLVCEYEYVERPGGAVIARNVTYFGYVGVLTGVRKGLSMSLNFRAVHESSAWWKTWCFRFHQALVLLGWRQSIASVLRECLLPSKYQPLRQLPTLVELERNLPSRKTTSAYLIFSDGTRTTTMEKDLRTAVVRSASDFIIALNHDVADENNLHPRSEGTVNAMQNNLEQQPGLPRDWLEIIAMQQLVDASKERKTCMATHWKESKNKRGGPTVQTGDVLEWMRDPEICNDETHYGVVMDPTRGEIVWLKRYLDPLEAGDPRD